MMSDDTLNDWAAKHRTSEDAPVRSAELLSENKVVFMTAAQPGKTEAAILVAKRCMAAAMGLPAYALYSNGDSK